MYCQLVWITQNRCLNNRINHLHECALRIPRQKNPILKLCLKMTNLLLFTYYSHYLVIEIYKVKNDVSPDIMTDIFIFKENNN